jgi:hypothetical protein
MTWALGGVVVQIDDDRGDQEFLQALASREGYFAVSATYASGATYQGTGQIIGEIEYSNQTAAATVALEGTGTLSKQ